MRDGEIIGCMGLTEPGYGSDAGAMETRAKKVDGGYRLNGTKQWITNSPLAHVALVWAKNEKGQVGGYLLERGSEGNSGTSGGGNSTTNTPVSRGGGGSVCYLEMLGLLIMSFVRWWRETIRIRHTECRSLIPIRRSCGAGDSRNR